MGIRRCIASGLAPWVLCLLPVAASGSTAVAPLEIHLQRDASGFVYRLWAHADLVLDASAWRSVPPALAFGAPDWAGVSLAAGTERSGRIEGLVPPGAWLEVQVQARGPRGRFELGASARAALAVAANPRVAVPLQRPRATTPGIVRGQFLYEDRLVDARGYTGQVQRLPLRHVEAELVDTASQTVLGRTLLDPNGFFTFAGVGSSGTASVRIRSWTRGHPTYWVRVVHPDPEAEDPEDAALVPHELRTSEFQLDPRGVDLGVLVERDPDGFGVVQAFHILDLALDAFEALGTTDFPGPTVGLADSLRIVWGPHLRLRFSAQSGHTIQVTSPGGGDTDGWSDTVVLHEVGHFLVQRFLRESNPGGLHLLGDVEQNLRLAWAEALATAFACWVREHRALTRQNAARGVIDTDVARYVNVGLPPPDGIAGGLQFEWDLEAHRLGTRDLPRDGIGSETTIAGVLWDLSDDAASKDAEPGDDDAIAIPQSRLWTALRSMRAIAPGEPITFEDFWIAWRQVDAEPLAIEPALRDARIDFVPDAAEPDADRAPALYATRPRMAGGGVVITEVALGALIAVEIANRDPVAIDVGGYSLVARANASSNAPSLTCTLPAGTKIGGNGRLVVHRGGGGPASARDLVVDNWTTPWFPGMEGAVILRDAGGRALDFVRWNGRDGIRSTVPPPAGTGWQGDLQAAAFGYSLVRREDTADRDQASDFTVTAPSLGAPNDTPLVARTFFPAGDADAQRWEVPRAGIYTIEVRRPRNGAEPRLEVRVPDSEHPITHVVAAPNSRVPARVTLQLAAGTVLEARTTHVGATRFGTYGVALYEESEAAPRVPPVGLQVAIESLDETPRARLSWWNGGAYDALRIRIGDADWQVLAGDAREFETPLARGRVGVELEAITATGVVAAPSLQLDVDSWPTTVSDALAPELQPGWLTQGFDFAAAAGRAVALGGSQGSARRWRAVRIEPGSVLRFDHICAAAPERGAVVEVSADWGATWEALGRFDFDSARDDGVDWRDGAASTDWVSEEFALERWVGKPLQVRFRLAAGPGEGWFIAALSITHEASAPPPFVALLYPAAPNPFNPTTRLRFELSQASPVRLEVYDVRGRHCRTLVASSLPAGIHSAEWDGHDAGGHALASGVYFARLRAGAIDAARKLVLVR